MFAILSVLENAREKTLCFASKPDAERFKCFVLTYMEESGAGNGYDAYWVDPEAKIVQTDSVPDGCQIMLNKKYVDTMLARVREARYAGDRSCDEAIAFDVPLLPDRKRPTKGETFRSLVSQGASMKIEGRVVNDKGSTLEVICCWDEDERGKPKPGATIFELETCQTMKIPDRKRP